MGGSYDGEADGQGSSKGRGDFGNYTEKFMFGFSTIGGGYHQGVDYSLTGGPNLTAEGNFTGGQEASGLAGVRHRPRLSLGNAKNRRVESYAGANDSNEPFESGFANLEPKLNKTRSH